MTRITGLDGSSPPRASRRTVDGAAGDGAAGFFVADPSDLAATASETGAPAQAGPAQGLAAMLAMQETALDETGAAPRRRDQAARRHGRDLLAALTGLQRTLLGQADGGASRASLQALLDHPPAAADPGLAAVLRAIALRAHLELARTTGLRVRPTAAADRDANRSWRGSHAPL